MSGGDAGNRSDACASVMHDAPYAVGGEAPVEAQMSGEGAQILDAERGSRADGAAHASSGEAAVDVCSSAATGHAAAVVERACVGAGHTTAVVERAMPAPFDDAHCHVAFMADPAAFERDAARAGSRILSVTTTPQEYVRLAARLTRASWGEEEGGLSDPAAPVPACRGARADARGGNGPAGHTGDSAILCQAVGLHPWWVPQDASALDALLVEFDAHLVKTRFVGEVGLDFSERRGGTRDGQLRAFERIVRACARAGEKTLSVHCVRAYDDALDVLERTGCAASCACVFHWFSGSSDQLQRAIKLGCWFSVGERMLATKRGRAYARAMPHDRLLLETDEPYVADPLAETPSVACAYDDVAASLFRAADLLAAARGIAPEELAQTLRANGNALFG